LIHGEQAAALGTTLKVPLTQAEQIRSEVGEGTPET